MPKKLDACMFCEEVPCSCGKPKKAPAKRVIERGDAVKPSPPPQQKMDTQLLRAAMKAAVKPTAPTIKATMKVAVDEAANSLREEEAEMIRAITCLQSVLHPDELWRIK